MGLRKQKREIARARLAAMGFDRINKRFSAHDENGVKNWKRALTDQNAKRAQLSKGFKARRKLKKVSA